jgi:hypothetical protein
MSSTSLGDEYLFRRRLLDDLEADLMGPQARDEVIVDPPITAYIVGVLYPQSADSLDPEFDNDLAEEDQETAPDPAVSLAHVRYPSSMGVSFAVDPTVTGQLDVRIRCGRYEQADEGVGASDPSSRSRTRRQSGPEGLWSRIDIDESVPVRLGVADPGTRRTVCDGLSLFTRSRVAGNALAITLVLINTKTAPTGSVSKDPLSFFQTTLQVTAAKASKPPFVERPSPGLVSDDRDMKSYGLLYRHARVYAIGHGCAATWQVADSVGDYIGTSYVPTHELLLAVSSPTIDLRCLSLQFLSTEPRDVVIAALLELPESYRKWIAGRPIDTLDATNREIAADHLDDCRRAADRMEAGIRVLDTDDVGWNAFRYASRAMLTVRSRADWHRAGRPIDGPNLGDQSWFPFQLGFFLTCIVGISDPHSRDRELVDLLWFPTGGGKTEAYLGLIAFTVFLRRLRRGAFGAGVTALMRYTLRLLTIQQFERAAALICSCELIRREETDVLGAEPISLGLWVGSDGTPNKRDDAMRQIKKLRSHVAIDKGNPVQVKSCPWCSAKLDAWDYDLAPDRSRLLISCPNAECPFHRGLPVVVVDEDVYDTHPTLLIATADKFAGIAWRPEAHKLFNLDRPGTPPIELIIQDELHLISGPLGTLAGLYEAAIDEAAMSDGARPKVVASTATIRRADSQSEALFARGVKQFPPPGIDARDSFFAVEADREEKGTRLYVGLLAPGSSQTTLLVRTYARLLQSALELEGNPDARDPYWTLLGYFNSLRVLGGARMQVHNDVEDRLKLLQPDDSTRRSIDKVIELTSRESSADIPGYLEHLAVKVPDALDVVLATNMISVGVDIDRLGLMVVMGQPQGTAEYIQATSRIGRKHAGLVVVLLNAGRSRDRSHYEAFSGYHGALYRQVESSSVTPYSPRARDRALHAALIAAVRMTMPELRGNEDAARVRSHLAGVLGMRDKLVARAKIVAPVDAEDVQAQLDEIIARWLRRADENPRLKYRDKLATEALLVDAAEVEDDEAFGTLWSLRDVDRSSNLFLLR